MHKQVFKNVVIEGLSTSSGPIIVSSAEIEDRLSPLYNKLGIPFGTLEKLSGISTRRFWEPSFMPSNIAEEAARKTLDVTGFDTSKIGAIINCSVSRDYFEPATAALVHRRLEFPSSTVAFDITNACLGFSNGLSILGTMIDAGVIQAGLLITGETVSGIAENTIQTLMRRGDISRDDLLKLLPVLTLGCGGVAAVVTHTKHARNGHKVHAMVADTASEFNDLCSGNGDFCIKQFNELDYPSMSEEELAQQPLMFTEASKLISSAAKIGGGTWSKLSEISGWKKEDLSMAVCHQVGRQVNDAFYKEIGILGTPEYTIYKDYGNMVTAAMPSALCLADEHGAIKRGDKVLTLGFGSGLNSIFTAWEW